MRWTDGSLLVGRVLFGVFFAFAAVNHFTTPGMVAAAAANGVPFPQAAVWGTGLMLAVASLGLVLGVLPRVSLALVIVFLVGVTPVMHDFWTLADPEAQAAQMGNFLRNIALLGAALGLMAVPTPWNLSVTSAYRHERQAPERARPRA